MTKKTSAFSQMRKQSSNLEAIQKKLKSNTRAKDERFWSAELDKAGNGSAVIRFLPFPEGETENYAKYFQYSFQENGRWLWAISPLTIGKPDPINELLDPLWKGTEEDKKVARRRGKKKKYVANIYVVKDPANPENEGKNFLFRFGPAIFKKIETALVPEFEDEEAINPFDMFEDGANFKLRIGRKGEYANYDSCAWEPKGPLFDDDAKAEEVWNKEYPLAEFTTGAEIPEYDDLKKRYLNLIGEKDTGTFTKTIEDDVEDETVSSLVSDSPTEAALDDVSTSTIEIEDIDLDEDDDDSLSGLESLVS